MVSVHLQKYCPFLCFSPTVRRYVTPRRNVQCLFTYQVENFCIPTTRLYLTSRQVTCVDNQYHAITYRGYVNVSCRGNVVTTTRQTSDTSTNFCPRNGRGNSVRIIHLASCTMSNYWCFVKHTSQGNEAYRHRFLENAFVDFKFSLFVVHLMMFTATETI
jgi:hypothetical protein